MNKQELIEKINKGRSFVGKDIKQTLELDSLSLVDMVALVESVSGVKIKGSEVSSIKTFGALYDYLAERL